MSDGPSAGRRTVPSRKERRRLLREEMETAILDAAREVIREEGVAALNLSEVARRVGVRTPSLYEYFSGKMGIYDALFRAGLRTYAAYIAPVNAQPPSWDQVAAAMNAYIDFAHDHPELFSLVFERQVPGFEPSPESMAESRALLQQGLDALQAMIDAGEMAPGLPVEQALDLLNAVMHGLAAGQIANSPQYGAGTGRFGRLTPAAVQLFQSAWQARSETGGDHRGTPDA